MAKNTHSILSDPVQEAQFLGLLHDMEKNPIYNTESRYVGDGEKYPDHLISFSQRHMDYLKKFPNIDPMKYLSNLRMMTRARQ